MLNQPLIYIYHIVHIHERKLHVRLGELRLSVRPQIFIPKTPCDLKISVITGTHQKLFIQLGRLGQRIEIPRMHTAGHQIIPGTFRRRLTKNRRLNLKKAFLRHKSAHFCRNLTAQYHLLLQVRTAQIQVTIF